jgi:hypothetical protein
MSITQEARAGKDYLFAGKEFVSQEQKEVC